MPMDVNYLTALLLLSERGNASYSIHWFGTRLTLDADERR